MCNYANVPSNENQKVTADYVRENGSCIASGQQSGEISKLTSGYYYFCYVTADGIVSDVFPQPNALEVDVDAPKVSVDAIVTVNGKSEITFTVKDEGNEGDFVSGIDDKCYNTHCRTEPKCPSVFHKHIPECKVPFARRSDYMSMV